MGESELGASDFSVAVVCTQHRYAGQVPFLIVAASEDEISMAADTIRAQGIDCLVYGGGTKVVGSNGLIGIRYETRSYTDIKRMGDIKGIVPVATATPSSPFLFAWPASQEAVESIPKSLETRMKSL